MGPELRDRRAQNCQRPLPELASRCEVVTVPEPSRRAEVLLKASNFATGCARTIATTARRDRDGDRRTAGSRDGVGRRVPSSISPSQTSAVTTHASPITSAAWWPWCTPSGGVDQAVDERLLRHERRDRHRARRSRDDERRREQRQRLGVRTTNTTTATAAAANAPRDEVRYMTAAISGSGNAARELATRERREAMIESSSG